MRPPITLAFNAVMFNGCIQVIDLSDMHPGVNPIEDAPELVIHELKKRGYPINERPVVYLDNNERWDVMKVHNGEFDNYMVINGPTWEYTIMVLMRNRILDKPKEGDTDWDRFTQPWDGTGGDPLLILIQ